jgi:hypothetical protein
MGLEPGSNKQQGGNAGGGEPFFPGILAGNWVLSLARILVVFYALVSGSFDLPESPWPP